MKQKIIETLQNSIVSNQEVLKNVTQTIKMLEEDQNYYLALMGIVDDQEVPQQIRLAALIQMKVNVERKWKENGEKHISEQTKGKIRATLLTAMIRCQTHNFLIRTYKRIVTLIGIHDFAIWIPIEEVATVLQTQPENTNITILFASAYIEVFSDKLNPHKNSVQLQTFLKVFLPLLYKIVTGERKSIPLIYLTIKTLQKVFKVQMSNAVRQMVPTWMVILKQIIDHQQPSLLIINTNQRSSIDSYFFRSKKWASKIVNRFLLTHASSTYKKQNKQFAQEWIKTYLPGFVDTFMVAIASPNMPKTYFHILKCFNIVTMRSSELIQKYAETLMFKIIPQFVKLKKDDEKLVLEDPHEVLKKQQDVLATDGDPKPAASNLWASLSQIKSDSKQLLDGPNLKKSLEWIYTQLSSQDFILKQTAMNLLCRTKYVYIRYADLINKQLIHMIQTQIVPLLQCQVMMVKLKAIEVFESYGYLEFSIVNLQKIVQTLYKSLSEPGKVLINIKAAEAINPLLYNQVVLLMIKPYLKELLQSYLKLISEHQIENLVACLEGIVEHYIEQIGPFAYELVLYLSSQFNKFSDANNETAGDNNDEGELELAAYACIDVVKQIIKSGLNQKDLIKMQQPLITIFQVSFTRQGSQYFNYAIQLLTLYIKQIKVVSQKLWIFYYFLLYSTLGLPSSHRSIQTKIIIRKQKEIIESLQTQYTSDNYSIGINCIRQYIYKSPHYGLQQKDIFGQPPLLTITKIFQKVYSQQKKEPEQILNCAAIILNILENTRCAPQMIHFCWQIFCKTVQFIKTISGIKIGYSIFCLCLYSNVQETVKLLVATGTLKLIKGITSPQFIDSLIHQYQISRILFGFSSLFLVQTRTQELNELLPEIFKCIVTLINKLSKSRLALDLEEQEDQIEALDAKLINYWSQQRKELRTFIDKIDAAMFFEAMFKQFSEKQPAVASQLQALLSTEQQAVLENDLKNAKKEFKKIE